MKQRNGQALVEFVIILPFIIYILVGVIDFVMIFYNKNNMESKMSDAIALYKKDVNEKDIETFLNADMDGINFQTVKSTKYTKIIITKKQNILAPALDKIIGDPYEIKVERVILNEQ